MISLTASIASKSAMYFGSIIMPRTSNMTSEFTGISSIVHKCSYSMYTSRQAGEYISYYSVAMYVRPTCWQAR